MRRFFLSFTALTSSILWSSAVQAADYPTATGLARVAVTSPALATALQDMKKTLLMPRTPLAFDNGASASNCAEYANLVLTSAPQDSVTNMSIQSEYLVCDAVRYIASEPFIVDRTLPRTRPARRAQALFERLDLRSFSSSLHNRADDRTHTLKTLLASGKLTLTGNTVEVDTGDQFFALQVVAEVRRPAPKDAAKALPTEWIVWVTDERKDGNYRAYSTLVVIPSSPLPGRLYSGSIYPPQ